MYSATILILLVLVVAVLKRTRANRSGLPLPPGPRKYPIIGNLLDAPNEYHWLKYAQWSKEYNTEILHLEVLGSSIIVLNSLKSANEILSRRSGLTSSRPVGIMLNKLMGWEWNLGSLPYSARWRARRRMIWNEFNPVQAFHHHPTQLKHARRFIQYLLENPQNFHHHSHYTPASLILEVAYGLDIQLHDDPHISRAEKVMAHFEKAGVPGSFMVDNLPFLQYIPRWFPGAGFRRYADLALAETLEMIETPYAQSLRRFDEGQSTPSTVLRALSKHDQPYTDQEYETVVKDVASAAYFAGVDTTHSPLMAFFATMTLFPDAQRKAQQELDSVLGPRLPTFADMLSLPYSQALVWELLRWSPAAPIGIPHLSTAEDVYDGYRLPKGSTIFCNVWAVTRDEQVFPDAAKFIPERYLKDGKIDADLTDVVSSTFGFGRRICPGRFFARDTIWILVVSTLAVFDISMSKDEEGRDIVPNAEFEPSFLTRLRPFKCSVTPRSKEHAKLVEELL